jgi:hypothetical protein
MIVAPLDIYTLSLKSITKKKDIILFGGKRIPLLPIQVLAIDAYRKSTHMDPKCNETIYRAQSIMKLSPQASYQSTKQLPWSGLHSLIWINALRLTAFRNAPSNRCYSLWRSAMTVLHRLNCLCVIYLSNSICQLTNRWSCERTLYRDETRVTTGCDG